MTRWIEDQILRMLQRRCKHPGEMVAVDILEGSAEGWQIKYCRRCGAVRPEWDFHWTDWRLPEPNLWRGAR
jgi:hypothetical protein